MSTNSSKFSVENFDPAPDEELVCSICRCVFDEPVECPCRHIFCKGCITNWLEVKSSCPICRKRVFLMDIQQVVPLIKNMIAKLTLVCPNRDNGCNLKTNLENYNQHVSRCLHELISCKNKNCPLEMLRKDVQKHEDVDCAFRMILCKRDCNLMLPSSKIKHHNCIKELKKQLDESSKREESLNKHIEELTNELNTMKKKAAETSFNPFLFEQTPADDSSSSFMDSFSSFLSSDSDDYGSDSPPVLLRNLRSRLSYLDTLMSSFTSTDSRVAGNDRLQHNRPTSYPNVILSESLANELANNRNLSSGTVSPVVFDFTLPRSNEESSNSSNHSSIQDNAEVDEEFPTPAQCRILKRKRPASTLTVSSDSENADSDNRNLRSRTSVQQRAAAGASNIGSSNQENELVSSARSGRHISRRRRRNFPVSIVPIAMSSDSNISSNYSHSEDETNNNRASTSMYSQSAHNANGLEHTRRLLELFAVETDPDWKPSSEEDAVLSDSSVSNGSSSSEDLPTSRTSGLERTRELLELCTVETDPDWEPSVEEASSEDDIFPTICPIPAADILDRMLSDDEESEQLSDSDCDVDSSYEVLVPERTYDLLYRYTQEGSDDDEEWIPKRNRH